MREAGGIPEKVRNSEGFTKVCEIFHKFTCRLPSWQLISAQPLARLRTMRLSHVFTTLFSLLMSTIVVSAASAEGAASGEVHDHLPQHAEQLFNIGPLPVTNSMVMIWIVVAFIVVFSRIATKKMSLIPSGVQNFAEWLVESLYDFLAGILGKDLVKKTFWFFASIFILILTSNWMGLIPGVGTIGWTLTGSGVDPHDQFRPLLRGGNADVNMTAAMAFTFAILWFYWAVKENGLKGFLAHIFAPKGKFKGLLAVGMIVVFFAVGVLELVSIAIRPVALTFRLFGNVFAGETVLETMQLLGGKYFAWLPPIPFYFMELLVGLVQALVFMLLTAVFLKLICDHHDEEHDEAHH